MTEVPKWLYEVMKENGDLDENDMYHGIKVIPYTPIPENFEDLVVGEE